MEDWKVQLIAHPGFNGYQVYICRNASDRRREFITKGGSEIQVVKYAEPIENDIVFATLESDQLHALVEAFTAKGFKTTSDHKIEGLLEATKYHLEDMRVLALKKGKK